VWVCGAVLVFVSQHTFRVADGGGGGG
jgi:hypothetical protein